MSGLLLGVDVGTSSTKGVLVRPDGEVVATAERPHDLSLPRPGLAEPDADQTGVFHCCEESGSKTCASKTPGRMDPLAERSGTPNVPDACSAVEGTRWDTGAVAAKDPRSATQGA